MGVKVVGVSRNPSTLADTHSSDQYLSIAADMALPETPGKIVRSAVKHFGQVDILVNNAAAVTVRGGFLDVSDEQWTDSFNLNFMSYVRMSRAVLPYMLKAGGGSLIHLGSEAGRIPLVEAPDYSVAKAAVLSLSKLLSREFGPAGIRSNVVAPAHVYTPMWDRPGGFLDSQAARFGVSREEAVPAFIQDADIPLKRLGTAADVAAVIVFLAGEASGFINGAEYTVNGGVTKFI